MSDALLWNEIGNLYLQFGSHQNAIAAIKRAIEMEPASAAFQYHLGQAYYRAGEFGNALLMFRRCLQLMQAPRDQAMVWNKVGDTYRAMRDLETAMQAYKKADELNLGVSTSVTRKDNTVDNPVAGARKDQENGELDPSELLSGLKKLVSRMENSLVEEAPGSGVQQEQVVPPAGPILAADTQPTRTFKREPGVIKTPPQADPPAADHAPAVHKEISPVPARKPTHIFPEPEGGSNQQQGVPPAQVPQEKPHTSNASYPDIPNLQEILAKLRVYENITRTNPTNDRAWDTLGKLYKSLGRFQDAIAAYRKAIEIAPTRDIYFYYLGLLYSVEQQHDLAVEAFQTVLQRNPDYILAHGALAGVYHRLGQENKANHHIAIALPTMENESAYNRACFYAICGDNEHALEFLQQALKNQDTTVEWIKSDPDLEPVRSDPRYQEIIAANQQSEQKNDEENYYSNVRKSKENRILPHLNSSLAR